MEKVYIFTFLHIRAARCCILHSIARTCRKVKIDIERISAEWWAWYDKTVAFVVNATLLFELHLHTQQIRIQNINKGSPCNLRYRKLFKYYYCTIVVTLKKYYKKTKTKTATPVCEVLKWRHLYTFFIDASYLHTCILFSNDI